MDCEGSLQPEVADGVSSAHEEGWALADSGHRDRVRPGCFSVVCISDRRADSLRLSAQRKAGWDIFAPHYTGMLEAASPSIGPPNNSSREL